MEKRQRSRFPATDALHGGEYLDSTLGQFEKRIPLDPDFGSPHEGTVEQIPALDEGSLLAQKRTRQTSELAATEVSPEVALQPQLRLTRLAVAWFDEMPQRRRQRFLNDYQATEESVRQYRAERAAAIKRPARRGHGRSGERYESHRWQSGGEPRQSLGDGGYLTLKTPVE